MIYVHQRHRQRQTAKRVDELPYTFQLS